MANIEVVVTGNTCVSFRIALNRCAGLGISRVECIGEIKSTLLRILEEGVVTIGTARHNLGNILDALADQINHTEIIGARLILRIDAIGERVGAIDLDVIDLLVVEEIPLIDGKATPGIVGRRRVCDRDVRRVGQRNAIARSRVRDRDIVDGRTIDAIQIKAGPLGGIDRHVIDVEVRQAAGSNPARRHLD